MSRNYSDAPEVVVPAGLETEEHNPYVLGHKIPVPENDLHKLEQGKYYAPPAGSTIADQVSTPTPSQVSTPWWRKKKFIALIIFAVILAIGLAVGLGVGLGSRKDENTESSAKDSGSDSDPNNSDGKSDGKSQNDSNNTAPSLPSCDGGLCPRILSSTVHDGTLYTFARTKDDGIVSITNDGGKWNKSFLDLGKPSGSGRLISQPSSFSWNVHKEFARLDVYTIATEDRTAYAKHFSKAEGWTDWKIEGINIGSAVQLCRGFIDRLDTWSTAWDTGQISHSHWRQKPDDEISKNGLEKGITTEHGEMDGGNNDWDRPRGLGAAKSAPAIVCRENKNYHDMIWYDKNRDRLLHSSYNDDNEWSIPQAFEGKFIGDPSIWAFDNEEWHFLGVQQDRQLYHLSWNSKKGGYSSLDKLGGSLLSVPAINFLKDNTIDVVALGTDGYLQHLHFDGQKWTSDWEDLGIAAYSAPIMERYNGRLFIMALDKDGQLFSLSRDGNSTGSKWKDSLKRENLGGDLTSDFVTHDD